MLRLGTGETVYVDRPGVVVFRRQGHIAQDLRRMSPREVLRQGEND